MSKMFYKKKNYEISRADVVSYIIIFMCAFSLFLGFSLLFKIMCIILVCVFAYQIYIKNKHNNKEYLRDVIVYSENDLYIVLPNIKNIILIESISLVVLYFLNLELIGWFIIGLLILFYEINEYIKRKSLLEFISNGDFSKIKNNSKYSIYKINRVIKLNNCYRINYGNCEREYCLSDEYLELANILNGMSLGGNNEQEENTNN